MCDYDLTVDFHVFVLLNCITLKSPFCFDFFSIFMYSRESPPFSLGRSLPPLVLYWRPGNLRLLHCILAVPSAVLFWTEISDVPGAGATHPFEGHIPNYSDQ